MFIDPKVHQLSKQNIKMMLLYATGSHIMRRQHRHHDHVSRLTSGDLSLHFVPKFLEIQFETMTWLIGEQQLLVKKRKEIKSSTKT